MGYYDDGLRPNQPNKPKRVWFTALISSIIGGLVVLTILPAIATLGFLPYEIVLKDSDLTTNQVMSDVKSTTRQEMVQVNVSSQIIDAVEKVSDSVVGVVNIQETNDFFFQQPQGDVERGTGSGVIFDIVGDKAHIVTNYHVIEGAKLVEISLPSGERVKANLKGADPLTDLAVVEIDAKYVKTVATFGDSDAIRTGEPAIAIGNPLGLEFSRTVTQGIVSAKERSVAVSEGWELNVIQTDAAINPGNSGGALLNIEGQVIGINSLKIARSGVEGLGFAIPINDVIPIINDLVEHGKVQRPFMGFEGRDLVEIPSQYWEDPLRLPSKVKQGIVIFEVTEFSPAAQAGLKTYDVIVGLDGKEISNLIELRKYLYTEKSIGDKLKVKIYREGMPMEVELNLAKAEDLARR
jgi:serine protease Do